MCVAGWEAAGAAIGAGLRRGAHQVWGAFLWRFMRKFQVLRPASALAYSPAHLLHNLLVMNAIQIR